MLMTGGLLDEFNGVQGYGGRNRGLRHLRRTGHLIEFESGAVFGFVVVRQLRQLKRNQLAALQGTDDHLLPVATVRNDRRHQIGQHGLQQEAGNQHPGGYDALRPAEPAECFFLLIKQARISASGPSAIVSANANVHKPHAT